MRSANGEGPGRRRPSSSAWAYLGSVTPCRCGSGVRMAVPVLAGWLALRQSQQRACTHQRGSFQWLPQKNSCFLFSAPSILFICFLRGVNWRVIWTRKAPKTAKKCTILQSIFSFAVIRKCWEIGRQFREKVWLFAKNSSRIKYNVYVFLLTFERANVTIKLIFPLLKRYANFGKCCSCLIYCGKQKKVGKQGDKPAAKTEK